MSIEDKIRNAKPSDWLTKDISKWQVWLIVRWARFKLFLRKARNRKWKYQKEI